MAYPNIPPKTKREKEIHAKKLKRQLKHILVVHNKIKRERKVECILCENSDNMCISENEDGVMECTRIKGHKGEHIACGPTMHDLKRWENEKEEL